MPTRRAFQVVADPTFDETTIVGKVFADADGDGWQDEGEKGIPGVRLATVEGLVAETDAFGRYHFAAIDGGFMERGRNFIVKLDPATLPKGARVTTENPRVARVTPGLMSRFDFGVQIDTVKTPAKRIDLKLAEIYFQRDSAELSRTVPAAAAELADRIRRGEQAKITVKVAPPSPEGCTPACQLGRRRIDAVRRVLMRMLGPEGLKNVEVVADYTAAGGVALNDRLRQWAREAAFAAVSLLVPAAQAAPCPGDICETQPVEVRAKYPRALDDFGRFWASEDSSAVDPRLAVEGPDRLPVVDGRIDAAASFAIYTNYSSFVERYEVRIFAARDVDRTTPLAVVPVKFLPHTVRNLLVARLEWRAPWAWSTAEKALLFVVRAYGTGRWTRSTVRRRAAATSRLRCAIACTRAGVRRARPRWANPRARPARATGVAATPLQGRFLVMRPAMAGRLRLVPDGVLGRGAGCPAVAGRRWRWSIRSAGLARTRAAVSRQRRRRLVQACRSSRWVWPAHCLPARFERKALLAEHRGNRRCACCRRSMVAATWRVVRIAVHGGRVRVWSARTSPPMHCGADLNGQVVPVDARGHASPTRRCCRSGSTSCSSTSSRRRATSGRSPCSSR